MTSGKHDEGRAAEPERVPETRSQASPGTDTARAPARRRATTSIPSPVRELEDVAPQIGGGSAAFKKLRARFEPETAAQPPSKPVAKPAVQAASKSEASPQKETAGPAAGPPVRRRRTTAIPAPFTELEDVAPEFGGGSGALKKLRARFETDAPAQPSASATKPDAKPTPKRLTAAQAQSGVSPDRPAPLPRDIAALDRTTLPPLFGEDPEQDVFPNTGRDSTGKLQQMQELQHLLHNPLSIDLRQAMLDHTSSRAEVATRLGDLRHRQAMMQALSGVIGEEIEQLETLLAAMAAPKN